MCCFVLARTLPHTHTRTRLGTGGPARPAGVTPQPSPLTRATARNPAPSPSAPRLPPPLPPSHSPPPVRSLDLHQVAVRLRRWLLRERAQHAQMLQVGGGVMWQRRCRRLMCTCAHGDCAHVLGDIEGGGLLMMFVGACMEVRSCPGRRVATDSDTRGTRVCGGWEAARQQWRTFGACCMCSRACSLRSRGGMASWRGVQDRRCRRPPARDCCCGFGKQNARSKLARPARRRARGLAAVCVECRRRACSLVLPLLPLHLGAGPSPPAERSPLGSYTGVPAHLSLSPLEREERA